jgi:hypothetical protein
MSLTPSLDEAERACAAYGHEPSRCGFDLSRDVVMAVREGKHIRPDLVVKFGQYLLKSHASRLGDGVWAMYEQVYMALLQYGRRRKKSDGAIDSDELRLAGEYCTILCAPSLGTAPLPASTCAHAPACGIPLVWRACIGEQSFLGRCCCGGRPSPAARPASLVHRLARARRLPSHCPPPSPHSSARFPDSVRVRRLQAMMWEAKDEFDLAMADYDAILKDDPNNLFAVKRQVCGCGVGGGK